MNCKNRGFLNRILQRTERVSSATYMKVRTSLVFLGLVSPLTSSVWATILSGAVRLARASECDGDTTNAVAEPTAASTTTALKTALPIFMLLIVAMSTTKTTKMPDKTSSEEHEVKGREREL
jgi:hypothetical protein